jgi:hypothetical protein
MAYRLVGPNSQVTAQKHDRCPICLSVNTLTRYDSEGATEVGVQSGWLAWHAEGGS